MKKKITNLIFIGLSSLSSFQINAQDEIKLIGFTSNGQSINNLVKWNAGETNYLETYPVDYVGVLVGSSVYNSNLGEYYSRVLISENDDYVSKMLKYQTQNNSFLLTDVTSVYNGSAEVDMQTGLLYSYDGDFENNIYLNKYDPITQVSTNLGYYTFNENTFFFPDSSCYDSDNGVYYFIIQDDEGKKLVKSFITNVGFTFTVIPIIGENIVGNIGLEYSNEENTIHLIYPQFNSDTSTSTMKVGNLNPETGLLTSLQNIAEISALQLFNRTYDQNTETLVFIGINLQNEQRLYLYNTLTNEVVNEPLPQNLLLEIEADNYAYAQLRYAELGANESEMNLVAVYPNPAQDSFTVNFEGNDSNFELFDLQGKSLLKGSIQNGQSIDIDQLNKGIYILNIKSDSFNETKKIVVQ